MRLPFPVLFCLGSTPTTDRLTGSDKVRLAIEAGRLPEMWGGEVVAVVESRKPFLLYG
jgi:hypothetical protein